MIGWNISPYFVNQSEKRQKPNHFTQTCARVLLSIVWFSYQISVRVTNYSFFPSEYNIENFKRGKTAENLSMSNWNISSLATLSTNQKKDKTKSLYPNLRTCLINIVWFSCQISVRVTNYSFFPSEYNIENFKRGKTAENLSMSNWNISSLTSLLDKCGLFWKTDTFLKKRLRGCPCRSSICFLLIAPTVTR